MSGSHYKQWATAFAQRLDGVSTRLARNLSVGALAAGVLIAGFGPAAATAAAATSMVNLGQASSYAVLSAASVGNTVSADGAPHTTLRGDLGVKADAQPTAFPPGVVTGTTRVGSTAARPSPICSRPTTRSPPGPAPPRSRAT